MSGFGSNFFAGVASGIVLLMIAWIFNKDRKRKKEGNQNVPILAPNQTRALLMIIIGILLLFVPVFIPSFQYAGLGIVLIAFSIWSFLD